MPYVRKALETDPTISGKAIKNQFEKLILQPLAGFRNRICTPLIIVVDALDKCENDSYVKLIVHLLLQARFVRTVNVRVFVISRPKLPILLGFKEVLEDTYQDIVLHNIPHSIIEHNIAVYLID